jgi:hypothetical protein
LADQVHKLGYSSLSISCIFNNLNWLHGSLCTWKLTVAQGVNFSHFSIVIVKPYYKAESANPKPRNLYLYSSLYADSTEGLFPFSFQI